jgi:nicotinamidase-related amidase
MKPLPPFDPARSAVLVIDMQRDFIDPGAPIAAPGGPAIVPAVNRLVALGRGRGLPVIFTQEMHRPDRSDFGIELEFEPPHCLEGTPGMDLVPELDVRAGDYRILGKRRYDAFLGTDLETLLRSRGIETLLVAGVCTDICVSSTVQHARNADFRCIVVRECVAGTSQERHEAALLCLGHVFAYVASLADVDAALRRAPAVVAARSLPTHDLPAP